MWSGTPARTAPILSLATDGTHFYGTGYIFGTGGNLEGAFSANWSDGRIKWVEDCHGDSYGVYPSSTAVYVAGHPHYCLNLGGYNENPAADARGRVQQGRHRSADQGHPGLPQLHRAAGPEPAQLLPAAGTTGTASGQGQAAWAVAGNDTYVVWAGEFTLGERHRAAGHGPDGHPGRSPRTCRARRPAQRSSPRPCHLARRRAGAGGTGPPTSTTTTPTSSTPCCGTTTCRPRSRPSPRPPPGGTSGDDVHRHRAGRRPAHLPGTGGRSVRQRPHLAAGEHHDRRRRQRAPVGLASPTSVSGTHGHRRRPRLHRPRRHDRRLRLDLG